MEVSDNPVQDMPLTSHDPTLCTMYFFGKALPHANVQCKI